ncbi:MAG: asparagine--tRNA ligase [Flammeovirgaceae bacterium]
MKRLKIKEIISNGKSLIGSEICVKGWVRSFRQNQFIAINDGSTIHNFQAVLPLNLYEEAFLKRITVSACLSVIGKVVESKGSGQEIEILASQVEIFGDCDVEQYPLQPKKHSFEFLREHAHLRMRTNTMSAVFRIRHAMAFAIHKFFHDKGFYYWHSPIITASDAEGAGEMFRVTVLDAQKPPLDEQGKVNFKEDFFGKETNLTVSGQLEGEAGALALGEIYTFGPTFRAENSNTSRHLAEFWMIEPEMAFYDITDNMNLAEEMLKFLIKYALDNCADDLVFLDKRFSEEENAKPKEERLGMTLLEKLKFVLEHPFERLTYTQAIDVLLASNHHKKGKFKFPVKWGIDLQSEHERYLVEKEYKKPVILTDYPKQIKAFYMKQNEDGKTVRAMDILFPGIGEIVGGSQREERYDKLYNRIQEMNIPEKDLWWYLELRKFGTAPHSGFGLGFERLMLFVTGMTNIRDVIPFPRTPKSAEF